MAATLTKEKGIVHGESPSNYLGEDEHQEQLIKFTQRRIATLEEQKQNEKEEGTLSSGRKRWFNQEIEKQRTKLRELMKEAEN